MIFREPPGLLQEVWIPKDGMIPGCNSDKKFIFFKKKVATLSQSVSVSARARKKNELNALKGLD
jgi:hypothetical protein